MCNQQVIGSSNTGSGFGCGRAEISIDNFFSCSDDYSQILVIGMLQGKMDKNLIGKILEI